MVMSSGAMEREAKKEGFRKYLESSGVLDALTKGLVALYDQNDKPSSAIEFIQQKLGGPTVSEYEKLQAAMSDLQIRYDELRVAHQEKCREVGIRTLLPSFTPLNIIGMGEKKVWCCILRDL
ncbi:hypothetical protein RHMOL_Rhmol09G0193900 [Rhododendron molle]|uniref:Uncharacterized protein n=1 Tax=Rhododendron molle TaxID=49168 RepID=A0ACC0MGE6_RHOML|nr:hypothetical protein RHMOL_Rhmol09G0193900 [Rhododendron molle]